MKLYLDDERKTPEGWERVYTAKECIELLEKGVVEELSLDHDLGDGVPTGYDVVKWMEAAVINDGWAPPKRIRLHSQNPVGVSNMKRGLQKIYAHIRSLHNLPR